MITFIVTIVVTVLVAIPSLISLRNQAKSKIFFFEHQKLNLYNDLVKKIPDLNITYKGKNIHQTLFSFSGIFIFSGKKDVIKSDIQKGIQIKIDEKDANWAEYKIIKQSENLDLKIDAENSNLNIDFSQLIDNDFFVVEALGEANNFDISISHRIANVSKVEFGTINLNKNIKFSIVFYFFFLVIIGLPFSVVNKLQSFDLIPTYYDTNSNLVLKQNLIDTSDIDKFIPKGISVEDSILYRRRLVSESVSPFNFNTKIDSLAEIAASEYFKPYLIIKGDTKKYIISPDYNVTFHLKMDLFEIFLEIIQLIMMSTLLYIFIGKIVDYIKYNKISARALKLIDQNS